MRRRARTLGIAALVTFACALILWRAFHFDFATEARPGIDPKLPSAERERVVVERANELLDRYAAASNFSAVALIAFGDDIRVTRTLGRIRDPQVPLTFGSLAKSFTGLLIHRLVERRSLMLDSRVDAIVPELRDAPVGSVTVHQLLRMTSGLPGSFDALTQARLQVFDHWMTEDEAIAKIRKMPLAFAPGSSFLYSNVGYRLLAILASKVTGRSFPGLMQAHVYEPAGMRSAGMFQAGVQPPANLPRGHLPYRCWLIAGSPCLLELPRWNYSALWGPGATYARAQDFVAWSRYLKRVRAKEPELFARYTLPDKKSYASGIGNTELTAVDGTKVQVLDHGGEDPGYESYFVWVPETDITMIFVANSDFALTGTYPLGDELRALVAGADYRVVQR